MEEVRERIENNSARLDNIIKDIISPYCSNLDKYVRFIQSTLADGQTQPTNDELDDFVLNLGTLIYFVSVQTELLGIRDDISKAVYKEVYNTERNNASGTVADKNTIAELKAQEEQIINMCYNRAYKIMKAKVESAQELLSSCKKVLTRRMTEYELTRMTSQKDGGYSV